MSESALVMLACSASKGSVAAPAVDLYRGVMFETLRAHLPTGDDEPILMILSAKHGLLFGHDVIEPYDQCLTRELAKELIAAGFPDDITFDGAVFDQVLLAGGEEYRAVMRTYIEAMREFGQVSDDATVIETSGGIGQQRQQLGQFLDQLQQVKAAA